MKFEIRDLAVIVGTSVYEVKCVDIDENKSMQTGTMGVARRMQDESTTTIVVRGQIREIREAFTSGRMVVGMSEEGRRAAGASKARVDALQARIDELEREVARVTLTNSALLTGDL